MIKFFPLEVSRFLPMREEYAAAWYFSYTVLAVV